MPLESLSDPTAYKLAADFLDKVQIVSIASDTLNKSQLFLLF